MPLRMEVLSKTYSNLTDTYNTFWENRDKRMDGWPLMSSPLPTIMICATYVYIVKVWGPNFMKDRKPMNLKGFLIVYNLIQVLLSTYIFVEVAKMKTKILPKM